MRTPVCALQVPSTVNLSIKPRLPSGDKQPGVFPMEVHPCQMVIPPQESRFTTVRRAGRQAGKLEGQRR